MPQRETNETAAASDELAARRLIAGVCLTALEHPEMRAEIPLIELAALLLCASEGCVSGELREPYLRAVAHAGQYA